MLTRALLLPGELMYSFLSRFLGKSSLRLRHAGIESQIAVQRACYTQAPYWTPWDQSSKIHRMPPASAYTYMLYCMSLLYVYLKSDGDMYYLVRQNCGGRKFAKAADPDADRSQRTQAHYLQYCASISIRLCPARTRRRATAAEPLGDASLP